MKNHLTKHLRVCAFGTYEAQYPRNTIIIEGLRRAGAIITECHEPIWEGMHDKSTMHRGRALIALVWRVVWAYLRLIFRYFTMPPHDIVLVGYIGQLDMILAWLLTRFRQNTLVFNPNISLYDTFCDDRKIFSPTSLIGRLLWFLDHHSCRLADLVILDTIEHRDYFVQTFRIPESNCFVTPVGSDERLFTPPPQFTSHPVVHPVPETRPFEVLFVGKFIPLHGCETIIEAATMLRNEPVHFTMVGEGQEFERMKQLVHDRALSHVTLPGWLPYEVLPDYYARADICLGIFGNSSKALRVIPNKVYAGMAMGRAVLTGDTPAVRTALVPGTCIWVCRPADPTDLANQIRYLLEHPHIRERIAQHGYEVFQQRYTIQAIGEQVYHQITRLKTQSEKPENIIKA